MNLTVSDLEVGLAHAAQDGDDQVRAALEQAIAATKRAEQSEAQLAEIGAVLCWTYAAINGEEVSDFAESFDEVRAAQALRARADGLRTEPTPIPPHIMELVNAILSPPRCPKCHTAMIYIPTEWHWGCPKAGCDASVAKELP